MEFLSLAVAGAVSGAVYSLLAIGLVLSYSTSRIFNFGHASTAFASAYLYYELHVALGWSTPLTLLAVLLVFAPLMGVVWDRLIFSRLVEADESVKIVAGVGVLIVMPALVVWASQRLGALFGLDIQDVGEVFQVPGVLPPGQHRIANGLVLTNDQLLVLVASVVCFAALWVLLRFTPVGLRMRMAVDAPALARLRGINTARVSGLSWVLSFVIAGMAGVLAAPFPGPFGLVHDKYTLALFVAITAAVVGRLRSVPAAFAAGLAIGALRNIVVAYVNGDYLGEIGARIANVYGLTGSVPFVILFVALIVLGHESKQRKAGTTSGMAAVPDYTSDLTRWQRAAPLVVRGVLLLVIGLIANPVWQNLIITGLALAVVFLSYTVVTGTGGMVSLAQGSFATAAALTTGALMGHGLPFLLAAVLGIAVAAVLGALTALPAMRLSGLALTFSTLALALLCTNVLFQIGWLGNNTLGWSFQPPALGPIDLAGGRTMFFVYLLLALAVARLVSNLQRSSLGRAMVAVRTAEPAAAASAVSPQATRLVIFVVSAAIAGLGGVMLAVNTGSVLSTTNPPQTSFVWLAAVVVLGVTRASGAIEAAVVVTLLPRVLEQGFLGWKGTSDDLILQILFGLGAIMLASNPHGILAAQDKWARVHRDRRRARKAGEPARRLAVVEPGSCAVEVHAPDDGALLEVVNLHAGYGEAEVLRGINLSIRAGTSVALLGANGSGKSTFCAAVAGQVPATSGRILFDGEDITDLAAPQRARRGLVLVPESRGVFPSVSVEENLRLWLPARAERNTAYEAFPLLARRKSQPAGNLSGGEQQMLSLAPFLVRSPRLLVVDEPSLGLAQGVSAEIMASLRRLQDQGVALILVEEKARDILSVADRVGVLQIGSLPWVRPTADVDPAGLASAYLGTAEPAALTHP
jgi:ABC-type branched-subunit amino acid transport system ATPase component/branched-subunit amino acid ABC-type transport system permease component